MTRINDTADLGRVIREARRSQGYTQAELAEISGISLTYIKNIEHGKPTAQIGKALRLLQLLSVNLDATRRGAGPGGPPTPQDIQELLRRITGQGCAQPGQNTTKTAGAPPIVSPQRPVKSPQLDVPHPDDGDDRR